MTHIKSVLQIEGFDFAKSVDKYKDGFISHVDFAVSGMCNLRCTYCSLNSGKVDSSELTVRELKDVLSQCKGLGAITASVTGKGEPFLDKRYLPITKHINEIGLAQVWFTNGTRITSEIAKALNDNKVSLVVKLNTLKPEIHNELVGKDKGFSLAWQGLKNILAVYDQPNNESITRIGIQTLVTQSTLKYIPELLEFCSENRLYPIIDLVIPSGKMIELNNYEKYQITAEENAWLYNEFKKIMGYPFYGEPGNDDGCPYSIGICVDNIGNVLSDDNGLSCLRTNRVIGNIRKESVAEIYNRLMDIRRFSDFNCGYMNTDTNYFLPCPVGARTEIDYYNTKENNSTKLTPYQELFQLNRNKYLRH